ncbi:MAG: hypothetical protein WDN26_13880 [Chitinophagaceae bacterium]
MTKGIVCRMYCSSYIFVSIETIVMERKKPDVDVVLDILKAALIDFPASEFIPEP